MWKTRAILALAATVAYSLPAAGEVGGLHHQPSYQLAQAASPGCTKLKARILAGRVETSTQPSNVGKTVPYTATSPHKAIAACINWGPSTASEIVFRNWAAQYNAASVDVAKERALQRCRQEQRAKDCECTIVDVNDECVLAPKKR